MPTDPTAALDELDRRLQLGGRLDRAESVALVAVARVAKCEKRPQEPCPTYYGDEGDDYERWCDTCGELARLAEEA